MTGLNDKYFLHCRYILDRNVTRQVYVLSLGLVVCPVSSECVIDGYFLEKFEIPLPSCGEFVLPGMD